MNSEKVKEIKEALEQNNAYIPFINEHYNWDEISCADILTLINELESENKRLNKAINNVQKGFDNGEFISKDCQTRTLKQFVVKAKERGHNYYPSIDHYCCSEKAVSIKDIDELLKEYELRN